MDSFNFDLFCERVKMNDNTKKKLQAADIKTKYKLTSLDLGAIRKLKLSFGEKTALIEAINQLDALEIKRENETSFSKSTGRVFPPRWPTKLFPADREPA